MLCGWLARQLGQARVIGEIIGGILIGPSVFGRLAPGLSAHLFDKASFATFDALSNYRTDSFSFPDRHGVGFRTVDKRRTTAVLPAA